MNPYTASPKLLPFRDCIEAGTLHAGKAESLIVQAVPMDKSLILNILSPTAKTEALTIAIDMSHVAKEESAGKATISARLIALNIQFQQGSLPSTLGKQF